MSEDELKLNRRRFLKYGAVTSVATATYYGISYKTDALAQVGPQEDASDPPPDNYSYSNGP